MKVRMLLSKTFSEASPAALDTAIAAWVATAGEKNYVACWFDVPDSSHYCAQIIYTEG